MQFSDLKQKVSILPFLLVLCGFLFEFLYQFTCGACYYTGTITWWQHFLSDASSVLFCAGTLGLWASFFKNLYVILKRKPE